MLSPGRRARDLLRRVVHHHHRQLVQAHGPSAHFSAESPTSRSTSCDAAPNTAVDQSMRARAQRAAIAVAPRAGRADRQRVLVDRLRMALARRSDAARCAATDVAH